MYICIMEYKIFESIILKLKKYDEKITKLYDHGIDLINFNDDLQKIIADLLIEIYGKYGYEWISWFCYDNNFGEPIDKGNIKYYKKQDDKLIEIEKPEHQAIDEKGNPICHDIKSLWKYVEKQINQ